MAKHHPRHYGSGWCVPAGYIIHLNCFIAKDSMTINKKPAQRKDEYIPMPKKTYWHLYSLQLLSADKLARVLDKVHKHEFVIIK